MRPPATKLLFAQSENRTLATSEATLMHLVVARKSSCQRKPTLMGNAREPFAASFTGSPGKQRSKRWTNSGTLSGFISSA